MIVVFSVPSTSIQNKKLPCSLVFCSLFSFSSLSLSKTPLSLSKTLQLQISIFSSNYNIIYTPILPLLDSSIKPFCFQLSFFQLNRIGVPGEDPLLAPCPAAPELRTTVNLRRGKLCASRTGSHRSATSPSPPRSRRLLRRMTIVASPFPTPPTKTPKPLLLDLKCVLLCFLSVQFNLGLFHNWGFRNNLCFYFIFLSVFAYLVRLTFICFWFVSIFLESEFSIFMLEKKSTLFLNIQAQIRNRK